MITIWLYVILEHSVDSVLTYWWDLHCRLEYARLAARLDSHD
jgi:hypothetical protein